jgi:4-amino-4-deoxy-L-arabinose transferase-like glycosyltransferase
VIGALAIILALATQWVLQELMIYVYNLTQPVTFWNWSEVAAAAVLLALLSVTLRGREPSGVSEAPPGEGWVVLAILALAAYLRIVGIESVPPGFYQDEAINGLDGLRLYDIPTYELWSDSIGGRPTLFLYALGGALRVFGISYLNLKIVPITVGVASVGAVYLVGRRAVGPRAALWAAFLFAVSRWHIHFTRMAWEVNCVPLFSALGFALLLRGFDRPQRSIASLTAATLVLGAGLYTYAAYRAMGAVVIVFLLVTAISADRRVLLDKFWGLLLGGLACAALIYPLLRFALDNPKLYWARYADVSLTAYMSYHSTPIPWLHQVAKALLSFNHRGDLGPTPYLDPISGTLLLIGVASAAAVAYRRGFRLVWCWLLTFAALASLTKDSPHATRMLGMLPPAMLLAGYGAFRLFDLLRSMALPRSARAAVAAAIVLVSTGVNGYWYFAEQQQVPEVDLLMNEGARTLCSDLTERGGQVFWMDEVAYNCRPQCAFLFRDRGMPHPDIITLDELLGRERLSPERIKAAAQPVTLVINNTTLERAGDRIKLDVNGDPMLDLPARPTVMQTREGKASYFIYRF